MYATVQMHTFAIDLRILKAIQGNARTKAFIARKDRKNTLKKDTTPTLARDHFRKANVH